MKNHRVLSFFVANRVKFKYNIDISKIMRKLFFSFRNRSKKIMFSGERLFDILDSAVKDISRRVVNIDVTNSSDSNEISSSRPCSVYTRTRGDYDMTFVLSTDYAVLKQMTRNMKRGAQTNEEEVPLYMQEFLNILCGHIVSKMNKRTNLKVFFDVPNFMQGEFKPGGGAPAKFTEDYYYDSPYGLLGIKVLCN